MALPLHLQLLTKLLTCKKNASYWKEKENLKKFFFFNQIYLFRFGIRHDNDKACLDYTKEQNIMATSLTFNHNHYKWSNCSRHYFTQYLE